MENKRKTTKEKDSLLGAAAFSVTPKVKQSPLQQLRQERHQPKRPQKRYVVKTPVQQKLQEQISVVESSKGIALPQSHAAAMVILNVFVFDSRNKRRILNLVSVPETADQYEFERLFKQQIQFLIQCNNKGAVLSISTLQPFRKRENRSLLEYLAKTKVSFTFEDHPGLTSSDQLKAIVDFLNWEPAKETETTKDKSRNKTNLKLGQEETIERSRKKKKHKAYFDESNRVARYIIQSLHKEGLSLHGIAQRLNDANISTTRANKFHAKQVSRLLENYAELQSLFSVPPKEKIVMLNKEANHRKGNLQSLPVGFSTSEILSFDKTITLSFLRKMDKPITVKLIDHQGEVAFERTYDGLGASNTIDLDAASEDSLLYPGRYQLFLSAEGYLSVSGTLEIGRYLVEADPDLKNLVSSILATS